jgi:hypothetical protein
MEPTPKKQRRVVLDVRRLNWASEGVRDALCTDATAPRP